VHLPSASEIFKGRRKRLSGRPRDFDSQWLRDIWLFVQVGTAITGLSVRQFCKTYAFSFAASGISAGSKNSVGKYRLSHATLLRRYNHAVALLKAEDVPYELVRKYGITGSHIATRSPTVVAWHAERDRLIALEMAKMRVSN
jgi:hypothetical protein